MPDIFLSYRRVDKDKVDKLYEALKMAGLSVWIDKSEIPDFESITKNIADGLASSKVFLAYYSSKYPLSRACQWELTAAYIASEREGEVNKRLVVINPEKNTEHIHPVQLKDQQTHLSFQADDPVELNRLVELLKKKVKQVESTFRDIKKTAHPRWYGVKGIGSNRFVGRVSFMWDIHSGLNAGDHPIIAGASSGKLVQVQGMGGMGKSLLAEEYALRYGAAYPGGVFWLNAYGDYGSAMAPDELEGERKRQIVGFAAMMKIPVQDRKPDEIEGHFTGELASRGEPFLWVVDDLPKGMSRKTFDSWLAPHSTGKTLITTQSEEHSALGKNLPLDELGKDEAYELLTKQREPKGVEEEEAAWKIVEELGCHALAADVAGAWLKASTGITTFKEYYNDLLRDDTDVLELANDLKEQLPNAHRKSIAGTLLKGIRKLKPEGLDLLRLASVLAHAPIPADLVVQVFSKADSLDKHASGLKAIRAMDEARVLSLVTRADEPEGAVSVHNLVSRTIRFNDSEKERTKLLRSKAIETLTEELEAVKYPLTSNMQAAYIPHAVLLADMGSIEAFVLRMYLANYYYEYGNYSIAEKIYRSAVNIVQDNFGIEHTETITLWHNTALTLRQKGDLKGACDLNEKVLEARRKVLGEDHPVTLITICNLAEVLRLKGELKRARELNETALEARRRYLGEEHPDTLIVMNNYALTLHDMGNLKGARVLHEKVFETRRRVLGEENPITLISKQNLADTLRSIGELENARVLYEQVLEARQRVHGEEHPFTLHSRSNLAIILYTMNDLKSAHELQEKVLESYLKKLGPEHLDALSAMNNLAETLRSMGKLEDARILNEQVLETRRKVLGENHSHTIISMNNLALTLRCMNDKEGSHELFKRVYEVSCKIRGEEHPDTLRSMHNLAMTLRNMGAARKLYKKTLEAKCRILGPEHPSTTITAWSLFMNYLEDNPAKALSILNHHLSWLLNRDPQTLMDHEQRKIQNKVRDIKIITHKF